MGRTSPVCGHTKALTRRGPRHRRGCRRTRTAPPPVPGNGHAPSGKRPATPDRAAGLRFRSSRRGGSCGGIARRPSASPRALRVLAPPRWANSTPPPAWRIRTEARPAPAGTRENARAGKTRPRETSCGRRSCRRCRTALRRTAASGRDAESRRGWRWNSSSVLGRWQSTGPGDLVGAVRVSSASTSLATITP